MPDTLSDCGRRVDDVYQEARDDDWFDTCREQLGHAHHAEPNPQQVKSEWEIGEPAPALRTRRIPIRRVGEPWEGLPVVLQSIRQTIERSRALLALEVDWDEAGAPAISETTWRRATDFLKRHALWLWDTRGLTITPPDICPGPDASIDLHWDRPAYEMLINIPADPSAMAGFYGDDRGRISIKGKFDPEHVNEALSLWLTKTT